MQAPLPPPIYRMEVSPATASHLPCTVLPVRALSSINMPPAVSHSLCVIPTCFEPLTYANAACCWVLAVLLHAPVVMLHLHYSWHVESLTMLKSWTASCEVKSPAMGLLKASSNSSSSCSSWLMQHNPHSRHSNSKVMTACFAAG